MFLGMYAGKFLKVTAQNNLWIELNKYSLQFLLHIRKLSYRLVGSRIPYQFCLLFQLFNVHLRISL